MGKGILAAVDLRATGTTELIQGIEVIGRILGERELNGEEIQFMVAVLEETLAIAVKKFKTAK